LTSYHQILPKKINIIVNMCLRLQTRPDQILTQFDKKKIYYDKGVFTTLSRAGSGTSAYANGILFWRIKMNSQIILKHPSRRIIFGAELFRTAHPVLKICNRPYLKPRK
tara:strand:+ start:424 stop:750 length:327 start_codon:yes stop_codon:yes gene_type:complete